MKSVLALLVLAGTLSGCTSFPGSFATAETCDLGCLIHRKITQKPAPAPTTPRSNYCQEYRPDDPTCEATK